MKFNLLKWRDWRLKDQVCFLILAESSVVFFVIIALQMMNFNYLFPKLQEISESIALQQIQKQLNIQAKCYAQLAQTTIKRSAYRSITMNTLYDNSLALLEIQDPYDCLLGQRDQYSWPASYCFNFYGIEHNTSKVTQLKYFTALATQTLLIQDIDIDVLFLSLDSSLYYSRYGGKDLTGYDPLQRPWYSQFLNQSNPILISKPYLTFGVNDYVFSLSIFLSDIGMITSEFHFKDIDYQTSDYLTKVSMIDNSGLIYFSSNQDNIGTNIKQQGYTSESLQQIIQSRSNIFELNCPYLKTIFCLIKENEEIEIIVTTDSGLEDIFFILQYSPNNYIHEINKELEFIYFRLYIIFIRYTTLYIILRIITVIVYLCTFNKFMLIPLDDIIAHTQNKISKQLKTSPNPKRKSNSMTRFREAYDECVNQFTYRQKTKLLQLELTNQFLIQTYDIRYRKIIDYLWCAIESDEILNLNESSIEFYFINQIYE